MAWNSFCSMQGEECACFTLWKVTSVLQGCGSQTAFCLPALFVSVFLVWMHLYQDAIPFCLLSWSHACSLYNVWRGLNPAFVVLQNIIITVRTIELGAPSVLNHVCFTLKAYISETIFFPGDQCWTLLHLKPWNKKSLYLPLTCLISWMVTHRPSV